MMKNIKLKKITSVIYVLALSFALSFFVSGKKLDSKEPVTNEFWAAASVAATATDNDTASYVFAGMGAVHASMWAVIGYTAALGGVGVAIGIGYAL